MARPRILFQGSHKSSRRGRHDAPEQFQIAQPIAVALGDVLIREGFDVVLSGARSLDSEFGRSAVAACSDIGVNPRERIRTYPHGSSLGKSLGFGMVLEPLDRRWQEVRTFIVQESDAVGGLTAAGILDALSPKYIKAQQVAVDDPRLKTEYAEYPSPQGAGFT